MTTSDNSEHGMSVITYTRAQAIADGWLVDVTATAREAGFSVPVALSRAAWVDTVQWDDANPEIQDEAGRLWSMLWMCRLAAEPASRERGKSTVDFQVRRIANARPPGQRGRKELVTLRMVVGPGDTAEVVVTIMNTDED